ncbi:MAG TPA: hypothetical protein VFV58_39205 [Blastocatellia bacterium]|nr:hypothetical protein [Blastocatellia bacterium]
MENPEPEDGVLPCALCPQQLLSEYLASPVAALLASVLDLDFALQAGVAVTLAEIPYPSFVLLRQLVEERDRYQTEEMKKARGK